MKQYAVDKDQTFSLTLDIGVNKKLHVNLKVDRRVKIELLDTWLSETRVVTDEIHLVPAPLNDEEGITVIRSPGFKTIPQDPGD